ncbi:AAA family ATPase [Rhodoblastus sp.]|uniref:AAA family ATPase n=1 Tax=Rhodoblastus sp. TaxID=1962975 RepID=UPI003F992357
MRFTELSLDKYSCYSERTVAIPEGPGLTVLYGPNEAGKSTCLEAIGDFLFGVPGQTTRGEVYGYPSMRIGAAMRLANGDMLRLVRRKGNRKTLTDASGASFEDALLASTFLNAVTRERFKTLFGLNHRTLRSGGDDMLAAGGEIGQLIVEAGGGLRAMVKRIEAIDQEARALFTRTASQDRAFYKARTEFEKAETRMKTHLVSRESYEEARDKAAKAKEGADGLRAERDRLRTAVNVFERVVRVGPHLRLRDQLRVDSTAYADTVGYPEEFSMKVSSAVGAREEAERAYEKAVTDRDAAKNKLDGIVVSANLASAGKVIADLEADAIKVGGARENRPNRLRSIEENNAKLHPLRGMLGLPFEADVAPLLPFRPATDEVLRLAAEAERRLSVLETAEARVVELVKEIEQIDGRLDEDRRLRYDKPLGVTSAQFGSLVVQQASLDARRRAAELKKKKIDGEIAWFAAPDLDALAAMSCPAADDVRAEEKAREAIRTELAGQEKAKREAGAEVASALADIAALEAGSVVPTAAAVAEARETRKGLWRPIRDAFVSGRPEGSVDQRSGTVDAFEKGVDGADGVADRRADEAERVASLAGFQRRLEMARGQAATAEQEIAELSKRLAARVDAFSAAYPELAKRFPALSSLIEFSTRRKDFLDRVEADRADASDIGIKTNELAPVLDLMKRTEAKMGLDGEAAFAARVEALQAAIANHESRHAEMRRDQRAREDSATKLKAATTKREEERTWKTGWDAKWPEAMKALGGLSTASPADGAKLAAEWREASGILSTLGEVGKRLKRMDDDEAELREGVSETARDLGIQVANDAVAGARMLKAQWDENARLRIRRDGLKEEYETAIAKADTAKEAVAAADEVLASLAKAIGVEADWLDAAAARFSERRAIEGKIADAERAAMNAGDQLPVGELEKEWGNRDLDAVRLDLDNAKSRVKEIDDEIEQAILIERAGKEALDKFTGDSEMNEAVAQREGATAEMHEALERHLELSLASDLIGEAMAAVRAEQQDPMIARAAVLFQAMTEGEYSGIETDVDDKGAPIVKGKRANGETESVATLSEGTRDQLFLAFRLASLERYGESAEALPFIADDILVHFDDARSKATLRLLAEFGKVNQVLLFTHHESVRDAAADLVEEGVASVVELDKAA